MRFISVSWGVVKIFLSVYVSSRLRGGWISSVLNGKWSKDSYLFTSHHRSMVCGDLDFMGTDRDINIGLHLF